MSIAKQVAGDFGEVLERVASQATALPSDLAQKAVEQGGLKQQLTDDQIAQQEREKAKLAKQKLPGLTERDLKVAAQKIAEVRQKMVEEEKKKEIVAKQQEEQKKKDPTLDQKIAAMNQSETRAGGGIG